VSLVLLAVAALTLAVLTALVALTLRPRFAVAALVFMILADVAVLFLFVRHRLNRLVLGPLRSLTNATERVAKGDLTVRAPTTATSEMANLGERFNRMTEALETAQAELLRTEKLAVIGRLAAGVAHEVGNPLSAIGTYLDLLRRGGADPELLVAAEREVNRIDRIVRGLLAYARSGQDGIGPVDVAGAARNVLELLRAQGAFSDVEVSLEVEPDLPDARGTAHGLEQTLVNLVLNALDAAPAGPVVIGAAGQQLTREIAPQRRRTDTGSSAIPVRRAWSRPPHAELPDGTPGVLIWVADAGAGIPPEDRDRVFDPFYTTKEPGRGTGLGLAIVQGVVADMGGIVWVEDAREGGAAFKVFLPADAPVGPSASASESIG
jgi:signal transduction histidine kinase